MDDIIWKYLIGYGERFRIFKDGTIQIVATKRDLRTIISKNGCAKVTIIVYNKIDNTQEARTLYIDDLLAEHFLEQPNVNQLLVHIDGNLQNNNLTNLKYSDYSEIESVLYASKVKPIFQFSLDYSYVKKWNTVDDIIKNNTGYNIGTIRANISGINKSAYNYIWSYNRALAKPIINIILTIDENNFLALDTYDYLNLLIEYWKDVANYEDNYKISSHGNVFSKKLNRLFELNPTNDYTDVKLYDNNKQPHFYKVHCLVADHFIQKPADYGEKKYVVDHIDGNKNNNNMTNLRWATNSENSKAYHSNKPKQAIIQYSMTNEFIKKWNCIDDILAANKTYSRNALLSNLGGTTNSSFGYIWKYETPPIKKQKLDQTIQPGEIFVNIGILDNKDFSLYEISDHGKVKNSNTGLILSPGLSTSGYHVVALIYYETKDGKKIPIQSMQKVHRLVAFKFCPNDDKLKNIVNHIDENKLNNHHKNLEWMTSTENTTHSTGIKVNQIDIKTGKIIKTYDSIAAAALAHNVTSTSAIRGVLSGRKKTAYGYKWRYALDEDKIIRNCATQLRLYTENELITQNIYKELVQDSN